MLSQRLFGIVILILFLASLHTEAMPLRKRTVSEVQFMQNIQEHKQVKERKDWLQRKLKDIIVASVKPQQAHPEKLKTFMANTSFGT